MAINSIIGAYYYLRIIVVMYMHEHKGPVPSDAPTGLSITTAMVVAVAVLATLYLGLAPSHVIGIALTQHLMLSAR